MSGGDVEAIGAHCQLPFCHQLDFLPFKCASCHGIFCLDHRTETAHSCSNVGAWARARSPQTSASNTSTLKPSIMNHDNQCAQTSCKTLVNTPLTPGVHCEKCRRDYCLKHRMKEDHDCAKLTPMGVGGGQKDRVNDALSRLRAWGNARKAGATSSLTPSAADSLQRTKAATAPSSTEGGALQRIISPFTTSSKASTATSQLLAVNALKKTAKGDAKIPLASRVYIRLEAVASNLEGSAGAKIPRADAFYVADWSVGRVLDAAAKTLGVLNVNNRGGGEKEKLRVFHVEGGRLLAFGDKLGESKVESGDTLVLLRGVGDPGN